MLPDRYGVCNVPPVNYCKPGGVENPQSISDCLPIENGGSELNYRGSFRSNQGRAFHQTHQLINMLGGVTPQIRTTISMVDRTRMTIIHHSNNASHHGHNRNDVEDLVMQIQVVMEKSCGCSRYRQPAAYMLARDFVDGIGFISARHPPW